METWRTCCRQCAAKARTKESKPMAAVPTPTGWTRERGTRVSARNKPRGYIRFSRMFGNETVVIEKASYRRGELPAWFAHYWPGRGLDMPSGDFAPTPGQLAERVERFMASRKAA